MKFTLTNVLVKAICVFISMIFFFYLPVEGQQKPAHPGIDAKQNGTIAFFLSGDAVLQENHDSWAVASSDFDNDGDIDLFVPARSIYSISKLLLNDGEGQFESVHQDFFEENASSTNGAVWGDFDNDGQADLFICRGGNASNLMLTLADESIQEVSINPMLSNDFGNQLAASYIDVNNDGALDLFMSNFDQFVQNRLFLGDGAGGFERHEFTRAGLETSFSVSSAWQDFDLDGRIDLIVCNTNATENFLYRNIGNGHFERIQDQAISTLSASSVGASWGDYDNDGDPDLFIANSGNQNNHLFRNDHGQFTRILGANLVNNGGHSHGSVWADLDNDGWLDLYVCNDQGQPNILYRNNQNGTFSKMENFGGIQNNAQAVLAADFNADLKLDLFEVTRGNAPNALLLNVSENNNRGVLIKLIGTHSNRSAIGARLKLTATINGQTLVQSRQVTALSGGGVGGQSPLAQHFGLGDASSIQSLEVHWPSGQVQTLSNLDITETATLNIVEPAGTPFSGMAFHDANENCIMDEDETVIPNLSLNLLNGERTIVTNESGEFETFLEMGNYSYSLEANSLWEFNNCGQLPFFSINANSNSNGID
ncbi:MAG: CRTAC1 family protein, partial [Bacteroidota bacterium]